MELYKQPTPTGVYTSYKTGTSQGDVTCRMCGRAAETLQHVLSWCSAVAQSKYLNRHNAALKILFFEMRKDHKLVDSVPSWNSPVTP